jgi:ribosomal protein S12 methylthiotransferase
MHFYLINLGCAKNLVESENLTNHLISAGYTPVDEIKKADLIIINTCGFIDDAKKESIETILETLNQKKKKSHVIVFGCLIQRYLKELEREIPEVDCFISVKPVKEIAEEIINRFPPLKKTTKQIKLLFTPPVYKYVKISDGCKNFCSYCVIPFIRGDLKSRAIEEVVKEVETALNDGVFEINLIGQDLTAYGSDIYDAPRLVELVKSILKINRDFWLRLLYLYPTRIPNEILDIMRKDKRLLSYLDMPIQHVSDRILKLMNRDYTKKDLLKTIKTLRSAIPNIVLRSTLITGFPTETEEEFQEMLEFIKDVQFDHLGVFTYSPEEGTQAFKLKPQITKSVKKRRRKMLMEEQFKIVKEKLKKYKGNILECIVEEQVDELGALWTGRFYGQAPEVDGLVYFTGYNKDMGLVVKVKITKIKGYDLFGEVVF